MSKVPWQKPDAKPDDRMLCLIVYQEKVFPDIFIYHAHTDTFNAPNLVAQQGKPKPLHEIVDFKIKRSEVQAWICKVSLPLPTWVYIKRGEI